jgi:ABC-type uncharacterized transport system substrate-binding protein
MKRREFITLVGSAAAAAWPLAARAQRPEQVRRIGVLMARKAGDPEGLRQYAAMLKGLADLGWIEGKTIQIIPHWSVGNPAEALKFARELAGLKPDLLIVNGTPSLIAMRQVTSTIPIIFVGVADPVGQGFVPSLSRPGGNITGFGVEEASMGGKWLELIKQTAPLVSRIAVIYNPNTAPYAPMFFPAMQAAAPEMAVVLSISPVHSGADIEKVVTAAAGEPNGGLIVLPDTFLFGQRQRIITLAAEHRLPAIYPIQVFVTEGGLIAYGIDRVDLFRRAATYIDRIFHGALPAELPVQQPIKFELAVNLKTAKALGLKVPQSLLVSADAVIE